MAEWYETAARIGAGIATGGLSEVVIGLKPEDQVAPDTSSANTQNVGRVENPAWTQWNATRLRLIQQYNAANAGGTVADSQAMESIKAQLAAHKAQEPPRYENTALGDSMDAARATGTAASSGIASTADRLAALGASYTQPGTPAQTGAQAVAGGSQVAPGTTRGSTAFTLPIQDNPAIAPRPIPVPTVAVAGSPATQGAPDFSAQINDASGRIAPQIVESGGARASQNTALSAAANFQPNTSGVSGIRGAVADTSGAGALAGFQPDQTGIQNLDSFNAVNTADGVNALRAYQATRAGEGINNLETFAPRAGTGAASALTGFQTSTGGVQGVQDFAGQAQGPSAAEALLRMQSERDQQNALALARSARGGPAAVAAAMRRAQASNAATQQETRMQGAVLSAQEKDTFEARRLQALVAAGQLVSTADGQRLQALSDAGQILSAADAQKLSAYQAATQARTSQDAQQLGALTASGQLQSSIDQQRLGASTAAGQLRAQGDSTQVQALSQAADIRLQGSALNQQGQIAATQAELAGSAQKLQAISTQGQISQAIRDADINVLKANMDARLQQAGLDDQQVRFFTQIQEDARTNAQQAQLQAEQMGLNAQAVADEINLRWQMFAQSQLTNEQQVILQQAGIQAGVNMANTQAAQQYMGQVLGFGGGLLSGAGSLIGSAQPAPQRRSADQIAPRTSAIDYERMGFGV